MPWTLLVQGVDRHHAGVSTVRNTLPPLPRWRFDDVMVSFATDHAGVGPHFDRYDVFLLNGESGLTATTRHLNSRKTD